METPTIDELLVLLREQHARIEEQQARIETLEGAVVAAPVGVDEDSSSRDSVRMSRRGMLTTAALGTAGLVGTLVLGSEGTAAAAGTGNFTTSTTTPAVTATSTGTGNAVTATANTGTTIHASQKSKGAGAVAVHGTIDSKAVGAGTGVLGEAQAGTGVEGTSDTGTGVHGSATTGQGVFGESGSGGTGVYGTADSGIAVHGLSGDGYGYGVVGECANGYGVYGSSSGGDGVVGVASSGTAVYGSSSTGKGVIGSSGSTDGVAGSSSSGTGISGASSTGYGVYGTSPHNYGVVGVTTSGNGVYGQVSVALQAGVVGRTLDSSGNWALYGFGNIGATGTKSAVVPATDGGDHLTLYCMESPECWFEDFGAAQLVGGVVSITIDAEFAQTIHTASYHVFVQAEGECKGLSVQEKTTTGFVVRELDGGTTNVGFAYRIVARRRDVTAPRLNRVALPDARTP